ncbi:CMD domain-containing protein [Paraburkholderia phosphatilytica]|uniref:CMD domain-containing protein n=1 Tax=Paraburkholderia phosphatilytica TaxID=2282883 RepID=UPI001F0C33FE|nr:peroxidase-related enzyme [Paraburkholderia phosphatilytica]
MTLAQAADDVIDLVATPADPQIARAIRQHRPKIAASIQATFDALFVDAPGPLGLRLRFASAAKVATLTDEPALARFYLEQLDRVALTAGQVSDAALESAVLDHVARVTLTPHACDRAAIAALQSAGLDDAGIVTLSQLIGYVAFQARVAIAVRALAGGSRDTDGHAPAQPATAVVRHHGFTAEPLDWHSWLTPVAIAAASAEQLAVLDESGPTARQSPYYLTLVHHPDVLRERSATYNAIMYAPGGLSRAERELAALVVSTVNGCPYCASVHAQRLNQLTKDPALVARVFADPYADGATERETALMRYARRLTLDTAAFDVADVAPLRTLGLTDGEILDFSHVTAIFAWANRLMQTLGEPVLPQARETAASGGRHG